METIKKGHNRFYIGADPEQAIAVITYKPAENNRIIIEHTFVHESLKGQGIGQKLVDAVVGLARAENLKIIPHCSFAKKMLARCETCADVLAAEEPAEGPNARPTEG